MHLLMLTNRGMNAILRPRMFKPYGGCILDGNDLKFDRDRSNFTSSFTVAGGVIGTHAFSDTSRNELRVSIPSNTEHIYLMVGITRERPNLSDYEVIETDEEGEETVINEGGNTWDGITFGQQQQFLQQLHNNRSNTQIHDIRIPERYRNANGYENDIHTIYHIVRIGREQIVIEDNYTITGNRASIGGRIGDGTTRFDRRDENETRQDVTLRMQYTSSKKHNDTFATDYAITTDIDNDSPNHGFIVWENPNRRMDGAYVWYVELGPIVPTARLAVGGVRIHGL